MTKITNEQYERINKILDKYEKDLNEPSIKDYAEIIVSEIEKGIQAGIITDEYQIAQIIEDFALKVKDKEILKNLEEEMLEVFTEAIDSELAKIEFIEKSDDDNSFNFNFPFQKVDKEQHLVGGVVYGVRSEPDLQGDLVSDIGELRLAAERFMLNKQQIKVMHSGVVAIGQIRVVESIVFEKETGHLGITIPAGSWWLLVKILDERVWELVKNGTLKGFSMGGRSKARRIAV